MAHDRGARARHLARELLVKALYQWQIAGHGVAEISAQFAALAMGAHPYRVAQLHWHNTEYRPLLEKMGIDWRERWREFEDDLERLKKGEAEFMTWEDADA